MIAAGVANLRVDQTNEDVDSMLSSRLVTGNLDGSMDEPAIQMQIGEATSSQHGANPFSNKFSSHQNHTHTPPSSGIAHARNSMPAITGKTGWIF